MLVQKEINIIINVSSLACQIFFPWNLESREIVIVESRRQFAAWSVHERTLGFDNFSICCIKNSQLLLYIKTTTCDQCWHVAPFYTIRMSGCENRLATLVVALHQCWYPQFIFVFLHNQKWDIFLVV